MHLISNILYWISTGLLVPVIVLLIILFLRSLLLIGSFFGRYMQLRRTGAQIDTAIDGLDAAALATAEGRADLLSRLPRKSSAPVVTCLKRMLESESDDSVRYAAGLDRMLSEFEIVADRDLSTSKTLAKMGPMLGLMGTLIPMGPALVGLAQGDIASMAYNMQVAFSTTVVGLFAAAVGYVTQQTAQRWYLHDMTTLEYVAALMKASASSQTEKTE